MNLAIASGRSVEDGTSRSSGSVWPPRQAGIVPLAAGRGARGGIPSGGPRSSGREPPPEPFDEDKIHIAEIAREQLFDRGRGGVPLHHRQLRSRCDHHRVGAGRCEAGGCPSPGGRCRTGRVVLDPPTCRPLRFNAGISPPARSSSRSGIPTMAIGVRFFIAVPASVRRGPSIGGGDRPGRSGTHRDGFRPCRWRRRVGKAQWSGRPFRGRQTSSAQRVITGVDGPGVNGIQPPGSMPEMSMPISLRTRTASGERRRGTICGKTLPLEGREAGDPSAI